MKSLLTFTFFLVIQHTTLAQHTPIEFKKEIIGDSIHVSVKNKLPAPVTFQLTCDTVNVKLNTLLLPNMDFMKVLKMSNLLENDSASLSPFLEVSARIGDPEAIHDKEYEYSFPFGVGNFCKLIQGFKGKFSHQSEHSMYALDFKMDVGNSVHAARGGIVCYYQDEFTEGGRDREKYLKKNNRIMILHEDGTIAAYNHLKKDGVLVELGQRVKTGDLIGLSGNTGFSTTPHLHFVVRSGNTSVPFKMGKKKKLKTGKRYGG